MESSLVGMKVSDEASYLGSEVGSSVGFSLGGPGSEVGSTEGKFFGTLWCPRGYLGGVYSSSLS